MGSQLSEQAGTDVVDSVVDTPPRHWPTVTKIAFRFCFLYFGLFCLLFAQITFAFLGIIGQWLPEQAVMWQMTVLGPALTWVGREVFGVEAVLHQDSGSGDQTAVWVLTFCILVVATVGTAVWTLVDRRRPDYARLSAWFLTFLRLCVAGQMLFYGFAKLVPIQMPTPPPSALLRSYGDFSPASVLWLQVGSSQPYEMTLGAVEVLAGLLMFLPRTATLGTLLGLASMAQVFLLNMTFDVPVKILSGHLMLMSMVLLAPQARRLLDVLVLDRPVASSTAPYPFRTRRARWIAALVQVGIGVWVAVALTHVSLQLWDEGPGRTKPPLYGIWQVDEFSRDGQPVPPLLTDPDRWQRAVFDLAGVMQYQRMDGTLVPMQVRVDTGAHRLDLHAVPATAGHSVTAGGFAYDQQGPDRLRFTGDLDGHPVTVTFRRQDPDAFPQRSRGFHWIQDAPGE